MVKKFFYLNILFLIALLNTVIAQPQGEKLFAEKCKACHTVGEGRLVGPDLSNVYQRRNEKWLINFIQSSQSLINSGDPDAVAIFSEYNKIIMPDQPVSAIEIKSILDFIAANSPDASNPNQRTPAQIFSATSITQIDIERGKALFEGTIKLTNGGAACISCHSVANPAVFTGGLLAKDLTNSFSLLTAAGIDGILRNPPFPAMNNAYGLHQLTDQEIKDLLAFLDYVDNKGVVQISGLISESYLLIGLLLMINLTAGLLLIFWNRVKKTSVNK
jgi:mono/diheme cytochrome c family protein